MLGSIAITTDISEDTYLVFKAALKVVTACEMEFKPNILILLALLLSLCTTVNGDSGRNSARKSKSVSSRQNNSPRTRARQIERNNVSSFRSDQNAYLEAYKNTYGVIAQKDSELEKTNSQLAWFRNLCILGLFLTMGMGLAIYTMWHRSRLQKVQEALRLQSEHSDVLQQRITHMQRTESLGMLASGVAHDFNNLLVGVLCNAELLEHEVRNSEKKSEFEKERIDQIIQSAEKAADLSRQMLAYAGKTQIIKVAAELNSIISRLQG
ncbi:hypothetical protein OAG68_02840, partial [bacterium]|nr:hypothetical protein [bacterium]